MFQVEHSVFIEREPQAVYDIVATIEGQAKWGSFESSKWLTNGPPGVGSTKRSVTRFLGRRLETTSIVTAWDPPHRYAFSIDGTISAQLDHLIEARDGGTQLTVRGDVDLAKIFKIAEPLLKRQVDKQMETDLGAIKLILEGETVPA